MILSNFVISYSRFCFDVNFDEIWLWEKLDLQEAASSESDFTWSFVVFSNDPAITVSDFSLTF